MTAENALGPGLDRSTGGRFAVFLGACLLATVLLEDPLSIAGAAPDFAIMGLVYGALRWGALGGSVLGFGLGFLRDTLVLFHFGLHALGMTVVGYAVGKLRETLYLTSPGVDLMLLAGAKLALDVLVLGVAAGGVWEAFEQRFFWEAPLSAAYTSLVGGIAHRILVRVG